MLVAAITYTHNCQLLGIAETLDVAIKSVELSYHKCTVTARRNGTNGIGFKWHEWDITGFGTVRAEEVQPRTVVDHL